MIENEFIPYEQALALKELGFDEHCFAHYCNGDLITKTAILKSSTMLYYQQNNINPNNQYKHQNCTAPLYQQAFRWFREEYNLWCCIQKYPTSENPNRCYYELKGDNINTDRDESPNSYMSGWFDSYEEAELACLNKLIELIKTK